MSKARKHYGIRQRQLLDPGVFHSTIRHWLLVQEGRSILYPSQCTRRNPSVPERLVLYLRAIERFPHNVLEADWPVLVGECLTELISLTNWSMAI